MILQLTNAAEPYVGKPLLINVMQIMSIYEVDVDGKDVTSIYSVTKDAWQVKETLKEIQSMLMMSKPPF